MKQSSFSSSSKGVLSIQKTIVKKEKGPALTCFPPLMGSVEPHTLILGTMPSPKSFASGEWFAHSSNSFWNIAGDALGFARSDPYPKRVSVFTERGYGLWDVLQMCEREGSKDEDISSEVAADIRNLTATKSTIKRLVFDSKSSAQMFLKHNKEWLLSKQAFYCGNKFASDVFGSVVSSTPNGGLVLLVMHSTSNRHKVDYSVKAAQWKTECYNI